MFQTKPSFPLFMPSSLVVSSWPTSQPGSPASQSSEALATGFDFLSELPLPAATDLLKVLRGVRDLTIAFDSFQRGDAEAPPIKKIIFARNLNQHELLTLPDLSHELPLDGVVLYELCRLGTFVYQMTVLLPNLHDREAVTTPYAYRMKRCLQYATTDLALHEDPTYYDLFLWVTIMTAWLVKGTEIYEWFVDFLVQHTSAGRVSSRQGDASSSLWPVARDCLATFLWLQSECEAPCAAIWEEVEASQIPGERCVIS